MSENKKEKNYEPNPLSLKMTIFVGIIFGFLILSWEIVENIPKYEYLYVENEKYIFNKINGNIYQFYRNPENDIVTYNLVSVIGEEKYLDMTQKGSDKNN